MNNYCINIVRYCIIDLAGSLMIEDDQGKTYTVLLANKTMIDEYVQLASNNDVASETVNKLQCMDVLPSLLSEQDYIIPISDWDKLLLHPASKISENFCCSILEHNHN